MITIKDTHFTSDIPLSNILMVKTKEYMLQLCNKLDLYVSPNLKKEETAGRVATELLDNPLHILQSLSKLELRLVDEFVKAGPNAYVHYKMRKNMLKLQKFCLVLTYEDKEKGEWMMLMPDCVREVRRRKAVDIHALCLPQPRTQSAGNKCRRKNRDLAYITYCSFLHITAMMPVCIALPKKHCIPGHFSKRFRFAGSIPYLCDQSLWLPYR